MENAIVFDPKTRAAEITWEQLAQTMEIGDGFGAMPAQCPIQAGHLIQSIVEDIRKLADLEPKVAPIVIREPYTQVNRKKIQENKPLEFEDYLIRRLVARIDIPLQAFEGTDLQMNCAIVLSYIYTDNTKGIQIAFGENVHVCDNLATFGGFHFSTYGHSKVPFEQGMELLRFWLQNLLVVHERHIVLVNRIQDINVKRKGFQRIIGALFERAVRRNAGENIIAPLNQTQVGDMVKRGLEVLQSEAEAINGWEMMNWATSIMKPHTSDMQTLIEDTANFNNFLCEEFKIPIDRILDIHTPFTGPEEQPATDEAPKE